MAKIDRKALQKLINKAGIGERTAKKLHAANEATQATETAEAPRSRGHGAASEDRRPLGDL